MSKQMINGDEVEVRVIMPDGTMEASATLTERELATVQAVDAALKANPEFQAAYPGAKLEGVGVASQTVDIESVYAYIVTPV